MQTTTLTFYGNKPGTTFGHRARILLDEIFFALALSNRAYYQGINRF